ncbi:metal-sulfur cluster biosynthetic enzyme [bacterium]|nr:MAG: metal-sulfur cluster biosynthetic enzyme [bacterium]
MANGLTEDDVRKAIAGVKHPAIDRTLIDLGIVKSVSMEGEKAKVVFAFPFPNIPIADQLIASVSEPIRELGIEVDVETTVMTPEEVERFLQMERESWTGGF